MWDLPGSGIEPVSSTLSGRFFTSEPTRQALTYYFNSSLWSYMNKSKTSSKGQLFDYKKLLCCSKVLSWPENRNKTISRFNPFNSAFYNLSPFSVVCPWPPWHGVTRPGMVFRIQFYKRQNRDDFPLDLGATHLKTGLVQIAWTLNREHTSCCFILI